MSHGDYRVMVGEPTGRYKTGTIVLLTRKYRSKWWDLVCFGQKGHYHRDGSCVHTDDLLARLNPEKVPAERVHVRGWGWWVA
jgi:hypothetical protein